MDFIYSYIVAFLIFITLFLLVIFLFVRFFYKQKKWNEKYVGLTSGRFFYVKYIFLCISFFVLFGTIFAPSDVDIWNKNKQIWNDVVFVLDVSKSMNVEDIWRWNKKISRLEMAKWLITHIVNMYQNNRYWLVIFSGDAISISPITSDYESFLTFLQWVDYKNILQQGSNFEKAMLFGTKRFVSTDKTQWPMLVLISDGGDEGDNLDVSQSVIMLKKQGIKSKVVWIWTQKWGNIPLWYDMFWNSIYQKYHDTLVTSTLNMTNLQKISADIKGDLFFVNNEADISKVHLWLKKNAGELNDWKYDVDMRIFIVGISFIFFICFFLLYCFENNLYKFTKKYV